MEIILLFPLFLVKEWMEKGECVKAYRHTAKIAKDVMIFSKNQSNKAGSWRRIMLNKITSF